MHFDCYLQHRGIKTLALRMERHCSNAMTLAKHLQGHTKLEKVIYPLLEDHPDYALAKKQMCGGGGIVTIVFKRAAGFSPRGQSDPVDPARDAAIRFCESVKVFSLAESLGGVESLVNHPAIMTHASIPKEIREARGVTDGLVRLSVGVEDIADLIADVDRALAQA